uniref:Uncharacterized protein n=1 Tax=Salmonella phage PMBT35 TaxID=3137287 RepID=A0AAU8BUU7_9VIRU
MLNAAICILEIFDTCPVIAKRIARLNECVIINSRNPENSNGIIHSAICVNCGAFALWHIRATSQEKGGGEN